MTVAHYRDDETDHLPATSNRGWAMWAVVAVLCAALFGASVVPSDYVVEQPGPTFDTLGSATVDGDPAPFIDIPMKETYPTTGSLRMLTVTTVGNRDSRANWFRVAQAWLDPSQTVVPLDEVYPEGQSTEESAAISQAQMVQSQDAAVAAALTTLNYDYGTKVSIVAVSSDGAAQGTLEADDVIRTVNGETIETVEQLQQLLADNGTTEPAVITVRRSGEDVVAELTPRQSDSNPDAAVLGISVSTLYDFPFDVSIELSGVGGPSAGQMFALAIIDKLTPGAMTGGVDVAGTGTIDVNGTIGPIGGIRQKMYGAVRAGADYFLAPIANCDEVIGHIPEGLTVFPVSTLADSISVLNTLSTGASTSLLTTCTTP